MRFAVHSFAFLVFICSWNLNQVFGRLAEIKVVDCEPEDLFCGVELSQYRYSYKHQRKLLFSKKGLMVLRSLLVLEDNTLARRKIIKMAWPWDVRCIGQFCVASLTDKLLKTHVGMNIPDPMVDEGRIDFRKPRPDPENFYYHAFPVPDYLPVPKFKYDCKDKKECEVNISAYGASAFTFNLKNKKLTSFKTVVAANGVGGCFDEYCAFVRDDSLEVEGNFEGYLYENVDPPKTLTLDHHNMVSKIDLVKRQKGPYVHISDDSRLMQCEHPLSDSKIGQPLLPMPIPDEMSLEKFSPIRRFKAGNGAGVCAGSFCCFQKDDDATLYVNFNGSINDNHNVNTWLGHPSYQNLEELYRYTGAKSFYELYIEQQPPLLEKSDPEKETNKSTYEIILIVHDCKPEDYFCAVEVEPIIRAKNSIISTVTSKRALVVLRSLLAWDNNGPFYQINPKFIPGWTGACIYKFCVAITEKFTARVLRMNYRDPMVDQGKSEFVLETGSKRVDPTMGVLVPEFVPVPKFKNDCENAEKCAISISAYGALDFNFNLGNKEFLTFDSLVASNGVGGCFDEYCAFVDAASLEVQVNFDEYAHQNLKPPSKLTFHPNAYISKAKLRSRQSAPHLQIVSSSSVGIDGFSLLQCKPSLSNSKIGQPLLLMPIPPKMSLEKLHPIRQINTANGAAVCAGHFCCLQKDGDKTWYVNFNGSIKDNQNINSRQGYPLFDWNLNKYNYYTGAKTLYELSAELRPKLGELGNFEDLIDYAITLNVHDCKPKDYFCGVVVELMNKKQDSSADPHTGKTALVVRRSILAWDDNSEFYQVNPNFIPEWTGACIYKFCVAVTKNEDMPPELRMNYANPMVDQGPNFFVIEKRRMQVNPTKAPPVPYSLPVPKFKYDCQNKKKCEANMSMYGAPGLKINLPLDLENQKLKTVKSVLALNGVGGCFDEYCIFADAKSLELKANFNHTHYFNIKPKELEFSKKNELVVNSLIQKSNAPQVVIKIEPLPGSTSILQCGYSVYNEQTSTWDITYGLSMSFSTMMSLETFSPIRKFKAANGVGACAGAFCCFRKDNDETYYVNFQGMINDSVTPSPWYNHNHTTNLENLFLYTDTRDRAVSNPEPQESNPRLSPVVDGSRLNTIEASQKIPEVREVSINLIPESGSDQKQTELAVAQGQSNVHSNDITRTDKVQPAVIKGQPNVHPNDITRTDKVKPTVAQGQSNVHSNVIMGTNQIKSNSSIQTHAVHFFLSSVIVFLSLLMVYC